MVWESTSSVKYTGAKDGFISGETGYNASTSVKRTIDQDVSGGNKTPGTPTDGVNPLKITGYTVINGHNPEKS